MANLFVPRQRLTAAELNDVFAPIQAQIDTKVAAIQAMIQASVAQMVADATASLTGGFSTLTAQQQAQTTALAATNAAINRINTAQTSLAPLASPTFTGAVQAPTVQRTSVGPLVATTQYVNDLFNGADRFGVGVSGVWEIQPTGTLMQRGVINTATTGGATVVFPKAFSGVYIIVGNVINNTNNANVFSVAFGDTSQKAGCVAFVTLNGQPQACSVAWIAMGV